MNEYNNRKWRTCSSRALAKSRYVVMLQKEKHLQLTNNTPGRSDAIKDVRHAFERHATPIPRVCHFPRDNKVATVIFPRFARRGLVGLPDDTKRAESNGFLTFNDRRGEGRMGRKHTARCMTSSHLPLRYSRRRKSCHHLRSTLRLDRHHRDRQLAENGHLM